MVSDKIRGDGQHLTNSNSRSRVATLCSGVFGSSLADSGLSFVILHLSETPVKEDILRMVIRRETLEYRIGTFSGFEVANEQNIGKRSCADT